MYEVVCSCMWSYDEVVESLGLTYYCSSLADTILYDN